MNISYAQYTERLRQAALVMPVILLLLANCQGQSSEEGRQPVPPSVAAEAERAAPVSWPATDSLLHGIPIYEDFSSIEPLLRKDNDTVYVINFWATWCAPCIKELPYFEQLIQDSKEQKMQVALISLDFPRQLEAKLVPFVTERGLQENVAALTDGRFNDWIDKVSTEWGGAIPATLIYRGGQAEFLGKAVKSADELMEAVQRISQE